MKKCLVLCVYEECGDPDAIFDLDSPAAATRCFRELREWAAMNQVPKIIVEDFTDEEYADIVKSGELRT